MITLLSFGDKRYSKSQTRLVNSSMRFGVSKVIIKNQLDLFQEDRAFILKNRYVFRQMRGYGFWLWKPFLISKILNSRDFMSDRDNILFYCDSGVEVISPLSILTDRMDSSVLAFHINHTNLHYVKRAVYERMQILERDYEKYQGANQCAAGYSFFKNDDFSRALVHEWLELCEHPFLIDDTPTPNLIEFPGFVESRHDQSIFSMLVCKYGIKTLRDPSQYGNGFSDRCFDQVFLLHRKRLHPFVRKERFPFYHLWKELN